MLSVRLDAALEGPRPLTLRADCKFEVFWWDVEFPFRHTFIEGERPTLPPAVDVAGQVAAAIGEARAWSVELPASQNRLVALRPAASDGLQVHPLGRLEVRQSVAPLGVVIEHLGGSPVLGASKFDLTLEIQGLGNLRSTPLQDDFPLAQFFKLDREERLSAPGFQPMDAGCMAESDAIAWPQGALAAVNLDFEDVVIGANGDVLTVDETPFAFPKGWLAHQARFSAAGSSALRQLEESTTATTADRRRLVVQQQTFNVEGLDADVTNPHRLPELSFVAARTRARQQGQARKVALWADLVTGG